MRSYFVFALLSFAACPFACGQAAPAATAGGAEFRYALRYSESAEFGDTLGTWHTIDTSGSLDYSNGRTRRPFSLDYTGGYGYTISGPSYGTGAYHRLLISQGFDWRKWILNFSDDVGYRPQAPTTGFSGIPGTGEPIGGGSNPPSGQTILTINTRELNNDASGDLQHIFGHGSSLQFDAQHHLLRFVDGDGLDTDELMISAGPAFRLNARNSLNVQYALSRFSYPASDSLFQTHTIMFGFSRSWNRAFSSNLSAGPEFVRPSAFMPGSTGVAANGALTYQARRFTANGTYDRSTSGGSGYLMGSQSDSVMASLSRTFLRTFTFEIAGGYHHNSELETHHTVKGEFGSVQGSWRIGRYLNAFAGYTAMSQSSIAPLPSNVLSQLMQTVSFGFGYSRQLKGVK